MEANLQEIIPGKGLGTLRFGASRDEVKNTIGQADEVEKYSLDEFDSDDTEAWHYDEKGISLSFDQEYEWKLSSIAVSGDDYQLDGVKLVGKTIDEIEELCESKGWGELMEDEEIAEEEAGIAMLHLEEKGISFWFEEDKLSEVQLSPLYVNDQIVWP